MTVVISALTKDGCKLLGRYWRCVLKKPLIDIGIATSDLKQFKNFLDWKYGCRNSESLEKASKEFKIVDIDNSMEINISSLIC